MEEFPLRSITVIGAGADAWLAAATLARVLGEGCAVRVLESGDNAISGALASAPSLHRLLALLALDESALMRATRATYRLGTSFCDWGAVGDRYFHGFGTIGAKLDAVPFHHHWLRLAALGGCAPFEDFSMAAHLARLGRFAPPDNDPRSVLSLYSYSWHFDERQLTHALRAHALASGARAHHGTPVSLERNVDGDVRALLLADGTRHAADFFVDCTGMVSRALGVATDTEFALPCERVAWMYCAAEQSPPPCSEARATEAGWMFHTPLQHASVRGYVYSGEFLGEEAAHRRLSEVAGESARGRINNARLTRARPERFWVRNCLALPGGTLDPLEASGLHLAQTGITRFLAHLPASRADEGARREYDRLTRDEHDRVRDLLLLHYHASGRNDSPFWEHCRRQPLPGTLVRRLELFADSARVITGEEEFVGVDGWLAVLLGQRLEPRSYDPLAELTAPEVARRALAKLRDQMRTTAAMLPVHRDCIVRRGAAAPSLGRE